MATEIDLFKKFLELEPRKLIEVFITDLEAFPAFGDSIIRINLVMGIISEFVVEMLYMLESATEKELSRDQLAKDLFFIIENVLAAARLEEGKEEKFESSINATKH